MSPSEASRRRLIEQAPAVLHGLRTDPDGFDHEAYSWVESAVQRLQPPPGEPEVLAEARERLDAMVADVEGQTWDLSANDRVDLAAIRAKLDAPPPEPPPIQGPGSNLAQLVELCKGAVHVTVNEHRSYYMSIADHIADRGEKVDPATLAAMEAADQCVEVQAYPHTPIGFTWGCGPDIEEVIVDVLKACGHPAMLPARVESATIAGQTYKTEARDAPAAPVGMRAAAQEIMDFCDEGLPGGCPFCSSGEPTGLPHPDDAKRDEHEEGCLCDQLRAALVVDPDPRPTDFSWARRTMAHAMLNDREPGGLLDAYRANVAMLLSDQFNGAPFRDPEVRNQAAVAILALVFGFVPTGIRPNQNDPGGPCRENP